LIYWFDADFNGLRTWVEGVLKPKDVCRPGDMLCLDVGDRPLLNNIRHGLIDPDTPKEALTKMSSEGKELKLVVS
jgi:hypothetical protein